MPLPEYFSPLNGKHVTIVAFGDSITATTHWTRGMMNWVQLLEQNLHSVFRSGGTVINSGVSGDSLPNCLGRLDRDVLRFKPDIVIVSFGANDARRRNPEEFRKMYREMLRQIKAAGALIVTRTPTPYISMSDGSEITEVTERGNLVKVDVEGYANIIRQVSEEMGILCVDHYSLWKRSLQSIYKGEMMLLMGNCIHPNGEGHRRLYHEMAPFFGLPRYFQQDYENILAEEGMI